MREQLERLLVVFAAGGAAAIAAKRAGIPYNVALVVVGLLLVLTDVLPQRALEPELVLFVVLPILVFEGALFADADGLRSASRPIIALAAPGVFISLLGTAAVATFALGLPFTGALLLGALLAITDTVSVLLAFRSVRVPRRLAAIMEGESLFNDGTALVLVSIATSVVDKGSFHGLSVLRELGVAIFGGAALGAAFGAIGAAVLRRAPDHLTAILASTILVFATSLLAERIHASAVIAVVVAGLAVGRSARQSLEPSRVLALHGFWETLGFTLNVFLFLLVGMQIRAGALLREADSILIALIALHAGRAAAVYGCFAALSALTRDRVPARFQHVMVAGNIKGALSMAAVLALPEGLANRERLVTIVFGVTFVTLITQALPFTRVLRALGVTGGGPDALLEAARARLIAARRGLAEIEELLLAGIVSRREHAHRRAALQQLVIASEEALRGPEGEASQPAMVDAAIIVAQKAAVLEAARRGLISTETAEDQAGAFDRALIDLSKGKH